jgi:crossover junction endodeoxyribonuclease RuvC
LVILGIDPGLNACGYGVISLANGSLRCINFGCIQTRKLPGLSEKLKKIFDDLTNVIQIYNPHFCAIEDIFYHENVNTAIIMGHARGVAILAAYQLGMEVFEYTSREVKMSVTGNGAASKQQIQSMIQNLLHLSKPPTPYDASDALAVALCHYHRNKFRLIETAMK